jgi:phosphoribosylanthranilate isomerase
MFVKICGTTSEEDALLAVAMGADAIGFIFAPSTRQVSTSMVTDIVKRLPPEILTVGVFRDESPQRVIDIVNTTGLKGVQLHGHEPAEQGRWIRERVPVLIRAFRASDGEVRKATEHGADAVLIDSATPGSGQVFDWSLAEQVPSDVRLILAGGLTPENVADAINQVRPWGVDVATGVEREPGRKDARKLRAFIAAAKATEPPDYEGGDDLPFDWEDW